MLLAGTTIADADTDLIGQINAYRSAPQTCNGKRSTGAASLTANPALAAVRIAAGDTQSAAGGKLQDALRERGYAAAQVQVITVSGPSGADGVMRYLKERYCQSLLSANFTEIGILQSADTWRILLARPVLVTGLGDWREAGQEILKRTNAARAEARTCGTQRFNAAAPLRWAPKLGTAALAHSRDMAERNYFRHTGADNSEVDARATRQGYNWRRVGENIATGQGSPERVVSDWLSSPTHCANIMNGNFAEMGAAYAVNVKSDTTIYWTQVFGTPR